mmetsp:Transcript_15110/g.22064  ORF Transcript_15110/g.22064 Transcript_15110/m.22064 type:complete len:362 (-) Transcript_15110:465-1550(-)
MYDPKRKSHIHSGEILSNDEKKQMADALEKDYASLRDVMEDVNEIRDKKGKKGVSLWSIANASNKMVHTQVTTEHVSQGSDDPHDNWCKARFNLNKQLLIQCGKLDPTVTLDPVLPKKDGETIEKVSTAPNDANYDDGPKDLNGNLIEPCFDKAQLTPIPEYSTVMWDETHRKVQHGCTKKKTFKFKRRLDNDELCEEEEEGEIDGQAPRMKHIKFPGEVRLLLGLAVVKLLDGTVVGRRMKALDYTGKTVCSEKDMKTYEREEMHRVKHLKEGRGGWILNNRPGGAFWESERITDEVAKFLHETKGFSMNKLQTIHSLSSNANQGSPLQHLVVDFRQAANPGTSIMMLLASRPPESVANT